MQVLEAQYPAFGVRPAGRGSGYRDTHGRARISLESIAQYRRPGAKIGPRGAVPVVLIAHATHEKFVRHELEAAIADAFWLRRHKLFALSGSDFAGD